MKKTYLDHLQEVVRKGWTEPALTDYGGVAAGGQDYTFGSMAGEMTRLGVLFEQLGLRPGDKIALAGRNSANWAIAYLAVAAYRGVIVSILQDFHPEDIKHLLEHSESKVLFVGPFVWKDLQNQPLDTLEAVISLQDFSLIRGTEQAHHGFANWDQAFQKAYPNGVRYEDLNWAKDNAEELALINYTSGSTGSPKGVMLTYRSLSNNVECGFAIVPAPWGGKVVSMLPMAHMFGQICEFLYPLCSGCHIHFLTKTPTPAVLLKAMADVQPYIVVTVPLVIEKIFWKNIYPVISKKVIRALWNWPITGSIIKGQVRSKLEKAFGGNVQYYLFGGAALNPEVEKALKQIRLPISVGYGMTECGPLIGGNPPIRFIARSGGTVVPNMEAKIDHPNADGVGEVLVRGENVMIGYYKNEEATKAVFTEDGWMRTGDLGTMDKHNNIFLRGRNKTMLLGPSGQNIYPEEIEDKLNNMDGVIESVVVEREGKLVALIFPDYGKKNDKGKRLTLQELQDLMKENMKKLNNLIPSYSQITKTEIVEEEFEKTPKKSIKRFLYK